MGLLGFVILGAFAAAIGYGTLPRISAPIWGWTALGGMAAGALFFLWPVTADRFNRLGRRVVGASSLGAVQDYQSSYSRHLGYRRQ